MAGAADNDPMHPSAPTRRALLRLISTAAGAAATTGAWPALASAKPKATTAPAATPAAPSYAGHEAAEAFATEVAQRRGLARGWVRRALAGARRLPRVQKLVMPPPAGTPKNWAAYRARFVEPQRIAAGLAFWRTHEAAFTRAEAEFGVPAAIVCAIVGVETFYGRITGNFRVIDALATLAFDFPSGRSDRSRFFREELEEFLVWTQRESLDPLTVKGSFAGAIGLPQFMPSSINRFATDFDGNGHIDLMGSGADAVGSVARYLRLHGWRPGLATHHGVVPPANGEGLTTLLAPDIRPSFSAAQMAALGAQLDAAGQAHAPDQGLLALVRVENGADAPSHVAGTLNFWALTRYNRSSYYALAVIDLAAALQATR